MSSLSTDKSPTFAMFHVYTVFSSDIVLTDGSGGGPRGVAARAIKTMSTGTLVVTRLGGGTETITGCVVGFQLDGPCESIQSSGDGTTVTSVIVYW